MKYDHYYNAIKHTLQELNKYWVKSKQLYRNTIDTKKFATNDYFSKIVDRKKNSLQYIIHTYVMYIFDCIVQDKLGLILISIIYIHLCIKKVKYQKSF